MSRASLKGVASRALALGALLGSFGCDPVVSDQVDSLPGNAPGVGNGPMHRPGEPCLLCHDGSLGDPPEFTVAGTVFETPVGMVGADRATVLMVDSDDSMFTATTNSVGNFYISPDQWSPKFPLTRISVVSAQGVVVTMQSEAGRSGACATCHVSPAGPSSPGPVSITLADGGVPP